MGHALWTGLFAGDEIVGRVAFNCLMAFKVTFHYTCYFLSFAIFILRLKPPAKTPSCSFLVKRQSNLGVWPLTWGSYQCNLWHHKERIYKLPCFGTHCMKKLSKQKQSINVNPNIAILFTNQLNRLGSRLGRLMDECTRPKINNWKGCPSIEIYTRSTLYEGRPKELTFRLHCSQCDWKNIHAKYM